jgi:aryl-alcohol dehydrogenase-like predicted oxidoreductase
VAARVIVHLAGGIGMDFVNLGSSGLEVARIGLGTGPYATEVKAAESARMLAAYLDAGGNLIDTANSYGRQAGAEHVGAAESFLGRTLGSRRGEVIIATKGYQLMDESWRPNSIGLSRTYLRFNVESSLRRLRTDYIDLYQFHDYDFLTPLEETLRTIDDLVREGKIRYLGVSNWDAWHIVKGTAVARQFGFIAPISNQVWYNLADRSVERAILPASRDQGLAIIAWGPLGRGVLARGISATRSDDTGVTRTDFLAHATVASPRLRATLDALESIAAQRGVPQAAVALQWLLSAGGCDVALSGARTVSELDEALASQTLELDRDELRSLFEASDSPPGYPAALYESGEHRPASLMTAATGGGPPS